MPLDSSWSWFLVLLMLFVSFRLTSYHFPRHLIGLSIIDGISSHCTCKLNLLLTFPFLMTRLLDLSGLNFMRAQLTVSSNAVRTQRAWTCVVVDMVRSSMNPLLDGRRIPEAVFGPLVSLLAALMIWFMPITNSTTEMVQSVTIPFSNLCHDVVSSPTENRSCKPSK